jgi:hypothetical protein
LDGSGEPVVEFQGMSFAEIEGSPGREMQGIEGLVHRLTWMPATSLDGPLSLKNMALITHGSTQLTNTCIRQSQKRKLPVCITSTHGFINGQTLLTVDLEVSIYIIHQLQISSKKFLRQCIGHVRSL